MAHHKVLDLPLYPMVPLLNRWPPQATWFTFYTLWCLYKIDDAPQCTWFTFITLWCLYKMDDPPQCTWFTFYILWCLYKIDDPPLCTLFTFHALIWWHCDNLYLASDFNGAGYYPVLVHHDVARSSALTCPLSRSLGSQILSVTHICKPLIFKLNKFTS